MTSMSSKYYVKHNVTSGDVARVHSRVHLPEEIVSRFMHSKPSARGATKTTAKAAQRRAAPRGKRK